MLQPQLPRHCLPGTRHASKDGIRGTDTNEPRVMELLSRVEAEPENQSAWMEQQALNLLAAMPEFANLLVEFPADYNSTPGAVVGAHPVIMAAHGLPMAMRRRLLRDWLEQPAPRLTIHA